MHIIIDAFDCTGKGDFIVQLNKTAPHGFYKKCRVDGEEYPLVPVHLFGVSQDILLRHIGIKATPKTDLNGKEIEFA